MTVFKYRKMLNLRSLLPDESGDVSKVLGGTLFRNLIRGVLKILIAGFLTPRALGVMRAVISLFKIAGSLAEFGLDRALVVFVGAAIGDADIQGKDLILKTILMIKAVILAVLLVAGNIFAENIARWTLGDPGMTIYVRLIFIGVGGQLLWKFISGYLSAHRQFTRLAFFHTTMPLLMLTTAILLIGFDAFDVQTGILIYLLAPAVTAAIWWSSLNRRFLKCPGWRAGLTNTIVRFSRWIYLTGIASSVRNHINPLLLKNPGLSGSVTAGEVNTGLYSFGNDLANEIAVVSESLFTVWLPKAAGCSEIGQLRQFVRRAYLNLAMLMIPLLLFMFAVKPMLYALAYFRADYLAYLPSLSVFKILYVGTLFSLAALPMTTALYALKLPHIESAIECVMIVILVVSSLLLIPRYGTIGAAMAALIQRVVSFLYVFSYGCIKLRKTEMEKQ
jgi:O-antigen/teichoic acid export membrane protein